MFYLILMTAMAARPDFGMIQATAPKTAWTSDYSVALARAEREGKPLLIFFSEEWCQPCKMMKRVFKNRSLKGLADTHVLCYLIMSRNRATARRYKVGSATPAFAEVRRDGWVKRFVGYANAATFKRWLEEEPGR